MTIEEVINLFQNHHTGHKNGITRDELEKAVKSIDRKNRDLILNLWEMGYYIINDMRGGGYYLVDWEDPEDVKRFVCYMTIREKARVRESRKCELGYGRLAEHVGKINKLPAEDASG